MTRKNRRLAWSLIEAMVVMVLIAIVGTSLALLMRETLEAERIQAASYDRLQQSKALADDFRADVARAEQAPAKWQDYVADGGTLILQMKDDRHVVYLWHEKALTRLEFVGDKKSARSLSVPANADVEFVHGKGPIRLRLSTLHLGKTRPGQALEFAAAVGGDWR